jgi:hypothetical protein
VYNGRDVGGGSSSSSSSSLAISSTANESSSSSWLSSTDAASESALFDIGDKGLAPGRVAERGGDATVWSSRVCPSNDPKVGRLGVDLE